METVTTNQAKADLAALIERAAAGEEIVISEAGKPLARLVAYGGPLLPRKSGILRGQIRIGDDFDDPLPPEVLAQFKGQSR